MEQGKSKQKQTRRKIGAAGVGGRVWGNSRYQKK